ncbi:MAG TPA: sigma-70 family RNA polymerase sigma factor [Micromonosporaceae bacterium]|jgi:RNA polymerase sigma-70 factor (ECF subfamily)
MSEPSDEDLLASFHLGPEPFSEFYRRHVAKVMGMGVRRFGNAEDVADFVAYVFIKVMTSANRFDPARGSAVAWLYGVGANVAASMRRRTGRIVDSERRLAGRALLDADDYVRVEERIDAAAARRVYEAMQTLSESDRRLFELIAVDSLTTRDAASALGVSPVAARVRLLRVRRRLRAVLYPDAQRTLAPSRSAREETA